MPLTKKGLPCFAKQSIGAALPQLPKWKSGVKKLDHW